MAKELVKYIFFLNWINLKKLGRNCEPIGEMADDRYKNETVETIPENNSIFYCTERISAASRVS